MYGNFAGRDASRGMAKQSFDLGIADHTPVRVDQPLTTSTLSIEMLTPIDEPLDSLADLQPDEMYFRLCIIFLSSTNHFRHIFSENMRGRFINPLNEPNRTF
jgi:hypothetical protein